MEMAKKIRILLIEEGVTISELAEKLGVAQPTLSVKLKRNDFRESDLVKIAELLGVKYQANFVLEDGRKI